MEENWVKQPIRMVVIGGSMGSIEVLLEILPDLKENLPFPILVVIHRKHSGESSLDDLFASRTNIFVREIEDKEPIRNAWIFLAPSDYHVLVEKDSFFSLDTSEKVNYSRPSLDVAFESAADAYGSSLCGILLSGANADGAKGLKVIKENGGLTVVQDPENSLVPFMPQQAILLNAVTKVLEVSELAAFINSLS